MTAQVFRLTFDKKSLAKGSKNRPIAKPRIKGTWNYLKCTQVWNEENCVLVVALDCPVEDPEEVIIDLANNPFRELPRTKVVR